MSNEPLRDTALSFTAKGVLAYLLSHDDEWQTNTKDLIRQGPDGRHRILRAMKELRLAGYARLQAVRSEDGHFKGKQWTLFESPHGLKTKDGETDLRKDRKTVSPETGLIRNTDKKRNNDSHSASGAAGNPGMKLTGKGQVDQLCEDFRGLINAHSPRRRVNSFIVGKWVIACWDTIQHQLEGNVDRFCKAVTWYVVNYGDPFLSTYTSMILVCDNFLKIEKAMQRQSIEKQRQNGVREHTPRITVKRNGERTMTRREMEQEMEAGL